MTEDHSFERYVLRGNTKKSDEILRDTKSREKEQQKMTLSFCEKRILVILEFSMFEYWRIRKSNIIES